MPRDTTRRRVTGNLQNAALRRVVANAARDEGAWRRRLGLRARRALHPRDGDEGRRKVGLHARPRRVAAAPRRRRRPRRVVVSRRQRRHAELRQAPRRAPQPPPETEPSPRRGARAGAATAAEPDDVDLAAPVSRQPERVVRDGGAARRHGDDARRLPHPSLSSWRWRLWFLSSPLFLSRRRR